MEVRPAKRKKNSPPHDSPLFPNADLKAITCYFNGYSCAIRNNSDMTELFHMGFFGKGNLSKSEPQFNSQATHLPEILLEQQWQNRHAYPNEINGNPSSHVSKQEKLANDTIANLFNNIDKITNESWAVLKTNEVPSHTTNKTIWNLKCEDEPATEDAHFINMVNGVIEEKAPLQNLITRCSTEVIVINDSTCPRLVSAPPAVAESLDLNLQEAFFLAGALGKLVIKTEEDEILDVREAWMAFCKAETKFVERYVIYHWYRSRGWVVRAGTKYGGDFLLYEKGPPFDHSSCLVKIVSSTTKLSWVDLHRWQRLVETVKKDILLVSAIAPETCSQEQMSQPEVVRLFKVRETLFRRWMPSQQRKK